MFLRPMTFFKPNDMIISRPETEEYGISSFVFRSRKPFHPDRLMEFVNEELGTEEEEEVQRKRTYIEHMSSLNSFKNDMIICFVREKLKSFENFKVERIFLVGFAPR